MGIDTIGESTENSYYQRHREERLAYQKLWKQQNREKVLREKKRYRERHKDRLNQKSREYMRHHRPNFSPLTARQREKKREWYRAYYQKNKARLSNRTRPQILQRKYGVTEDEYRLLLKKQRGICAICGTEKTIYAKREARLAVDHCHKTGKVRGLLCSRCNLALSFFDDSPAVLARARRYLLKHAE
jgi:hypothetical protein